MSIYPNFIIAGAAKSWSSALHDMLNKHTDIFMSPIKEPNFYNTDFHTKIDEDVVWYSNNLIKQTWLFLKWQRKRLMCWIVRNKKDYMQIFDGVKSEKIIGESSIWYMFSETAAENIYEDNQDMKFLFILRNPTERRVSNYWMYRRLWIIDKDIKHVISNHVVWELSYNEEILFKASHYKENIVRFQNLFWKNNILVITTDWFIKDSNEVLNKIFDFLGIEHEKIDNIVTNKSYYWSNLWMFLNRLISSISIKFSEWMKDNLRPIHNLFLFLFMDKKKPSIWNNEKEYLDTYFNVDIDFYNKI